MAVGYEEGRDNLEALVTTWATKPPSPGERNEATTRLQLIDRLIFECLGWDREDCEAEQAQAGTFADYALGLPSRRLLIEAKREGVTFELPLGVGRVVSIKTLTEGDAQIRNAVKQAIGYCQQRGIAVGAIANGTQVATFIASRQDGVAPEKGHALVFSSLKDMATDFRSLWDNLSRVGTDSYKLFETLRMSTANPPPERLSRRLIGYPGFKNRNSIQTELRTLGDLFLFDVANQPELSEDFVRECYCESGALSQYAMVTRQILKTRYAATLHNEMQVSTTPATTKEGLSEELRKDVIAGGLGRRPIILLGGVGVGKSMFLKHLIAVEAKKELERAVVLYVDFGREPVLATDLNQFVRDQIADQLREKYSIDVEEDGLVRGIYHSELARFAKGIYRRLKETAPAEFEREEVKFLKGKLANEEGHLKAVFEHIVKGQGREIVTFLDNIDQRPFEFQERVFLIAQALAESWPGSVFVCLRPDSFYKSRSVGSLTAYQPRTFTIAPPRVDQVIAKRLAFAKKQLSETGRLSSFPKDLTISSPTLSTYLDVVAWSVRKNDELGEFVDNLSGGNIRTALGFLGSFIGSGHVDTRKILNVAERGERYVIPLHEFMRAVIYGDHEYFDPASSPAPNLLDISSPDGREHFLLPIILEFIERAGETGAHDSYVPVSGAFAYAQGFGFQPTQVRYALDRAERRQLLDFTPSFDLNSGAGRCRITTIGAYSYKRLIAKFTYIDAITVDTPIVDSSTREHIQDVSTLTERLARVDAFRNYLDGQWTPLAGRGTGFDWALMSASLGEDVKRVRVGMERRSLQPRLPLPE
jgi:hypothetical protein